MAASGRAICSVSCRTAACAAATEERLVGGEGSRSRRSLIKADANRQLIRRRQRIPSVHRTPRAERSTKYLAVLDDAAFEAATEVTPKSASPSIWWRADRRAWRPSLLRLLDELPGRHRERDHRRCRGDDSNPAREVLAAKRRSRVRLERFDLYPARLLGDSAYGSAEMIGWLVLPYTASSRMSRCSTSRPAIRDLLTRRIHLRPCERCLRLPRRQVARRAPGVAAH